MIYQQQAHLPLIFQVDEDIILNIQDYLRRSKLMFTNVLVVSGASYSNEYAQAIADKNNWQKYILETNTFTEVDKLKDYINQNNIDLILGVGGGKVIDTVKRVSYLTNINNLSIPTIISNDGLISPISVIMNDSGKTQSLPGMMPMGVIIDINVIKNSSTEFIRSASGDLFSNLSASYDWILAFKKDKENLNDIAYHLAKSAGNSLLYFKELNLGSKTFLRLVVQGLVNSGIAMSLAGTSRPCSGSEHLISHAIDFLDYSSGVSHGLQVGSATFFTLYLHNKLKPVHINFGIESGIPLDFGSLITDFSTERFYEIMDKAREMRPGRYTILSENDNDSLYEKYKAFQKVIAESVS